MTDQEKRNYKIAGARSMAKLVRDMRSAQNEYFGSKAPAEKKRHLKRSKALEERVDRAVDAVLKYTQATGGQEK